MANWTVEVQKKKKKAGTCYKKWVYESVIIMLLATNEKQEITIKCPGYDCFTSLSRLNKCGLALYVDIKCGIGSWIPMNTASDDNEIESDSTCGKSWTEDL